MTAVWIPLSHLFISCLKSVIWFWWRVFFVPRTRQLHWPASLSWFSHRGGGLRSLLGALPRGTAPVELHQPLDGPDAQRLPVRAHRVGLLLLPELGGQPHHLQPAVHALQGVLQGTHVLPVWGQQLWKRVAAVPQDLAQSLRLQLQSSGAGEGFRGFPPAALSQRGSQGGCWRPYWSSENVRVLRGSSLRWTPF